MLTPEQVAAIAARNKNGAVGSLGLARGDITALLADRGELMARVQALEAALVCAALPLETLAAQCLAKPYAELSPSIQQAIVECIPIIRDALGIVGERTQEAAP